MPRGRWPRCWILKAATIWMAIWEFCATCIGWDCVQHSFRRTTGTSTTPTPAARRRNGTASRPHGRDVIREMNRLGMVINVSHSSDETISQAIDVSDGPVVATHHGLRSVNNIPRNMPDWLLKKLAAKGGVIGFQIGSEFNYPKEYAYLTAHQKKTFWDTTSIPDRVKGKTIYEVDQLVAPQFPMPGAQVPDSVMMTVDDWVGVVDRAIQMVGEDHVAIGTDFDGGPTLARGMRDVRDLPMITEAMLRRGYSEERIDKFWGGNLLRVFRQITQKRT